MIIIDYKDRRPIYEQVVERFQELILKGVLEPDSQLPSVRNLAMDLSINPNTIQRAYAELERQGYIYSVKGKGSFISDNNHLVQCKKDEILLEVLQLVKEAKEIGITKEIFLSKVNEGFEEEGKDD
ncbi:GntR family transcriptional regulator [Anaeromicropila herbilytica]|uniref:GntR family transcriptional regulator n=1 Tax=Anaeromicropila herbilytica TaxID=2785025 RepID=A0A7R7IDC1_9FIRM|nr:GntR family transcriptional regulator [Anaeromicropila herbilytica]BCN31593.1 GntR family transcriptional regulator [Anaeromicropila herbilytica]